MRRSSRPKQETTVCELRSVGHTEVSNCLNSEVRSVGATERTNRKSLLHSVYFPDARNGISPNAGGVRRMHFAPEEKPVRSLVPMKSTASHCGGREPPCRAVNPMSPVGRFLRTESA
jgi:hypothetical protein